jgi:uncharacterized membrane protein YozB (DUF420 family)
VIELQTVLESRNRAVGYCLGLLNTLTTSFSSLPSSTFSPQVKCTRIPEDFSGMMTMTTFSEYFPAVYAGYLLVPNQNFSVNSISSHYYLLLVFHDLLALVLVFLATKVDAISISISSREHHDVFGKAPR